MLCNHVMLSGVTFLYFLLNAVESSRTSPAVLKAKAFISTKDEPNRHPPLWTDEEAEKLPVKATKAEGTDTGVEAVDDVSKDVPKEWEHFHKAGKALEHLDNPEDAPKEVFTLPKITGSMIMQSLVSIFMSMICLLCCAFGYTRVKTDSRYPPNDGQDHSPNALNRGTWRYGLCEFNGADTKLCFISCCCPIIRWSDTMRMSGLMTFWSAIFIMGFLYAISALTGGLTLLLMLCLTTYRRQQLRRFFGMKSGDHTTLCEDCCFYCWCSCCAIAQEARQLEEAYAVGYPLQIKEPLRSPPPMQPLSMQPAMQPLPPPSARFQYTPESPKPMPAPSWGTAPAPALQQQPMMISQQPMPSLPPAQPMSGSVFVNTQGMPMQSLPPQSAQSLPPQS